MFKFKSFKFVLMVAAVVMISSLTVGCSKKAIQELMGSLKGDYFEGEEGGVPTGTSIGNIHGEVKDYATNNFIMGNVILETDRGPKSTPIQASGAFDFMNVPMYKTYTLRVEAYKYYPYMNEITLNSSYLNVGTITLTKVPDTVSNQYGEILGVVTDNMGNPVNGASVSYYSLNDQGAAKNTVSTYNDGYKNGVFHFMNIPDGSYWIQASKYPDYDKSNFVQVTVFAGRKTENISLSMNKAATVQQLGRINGWVSDQNSMRIGNAKITITPSVNGQSVYYTGQYGDYHIDGVPMGPYSLQVSDGSFTPMGSTTPIQYDGKIATANVTAQMRDISVPIYVTSRTVASDPKVIITNPMPGANLASKKVYLTFNVENPENISYMYIMASGNSSDNTGYKMPIDKPQSGYTSSYSRELDLTKYSGSVAIMVHYQPASGGMERKTEVTVNLPYESATEPQPYAIITSPTTGNSVSGEALSMAFTLTNVRFLKITAQMEDITIDNWIQQVASESYFNGAALPYSGSWTINAKLEQRYKGRRTVLRAEYSNGNITKTESVTVLVN